LTIFNAKSKEKLLGLIVFNLFKDPKCQDAYHIASILGLSLPKNGSFPEKANDFELKEWIELGSKVNFAWLEEQGHLEDTLMSTHDFGKLRSIDQELHQKTKLIRDRAGKRWSSDWKQIEPRIVVLKQLSVLKPREEYLENTWKATLYSCARSLQQVNMQVESEKIQELRLEKQFFTPDT
jgi:hypothetical protein